MPSIYDCCWTCGNLLGSCICAKQPIPMPDKAKEDYIVLEDGIILEDDDFICLVEDELFVEEPPMDIKKVEMFEFDGKKYETLEEAERAKKNNKLLEILRSLWFSGCDPEDLIDDLVEAGVYVRE